MIGAQAADVLEAGRALQQPAVGVFTQAPVELQESTVQALPSSQLPAVQLAAVTDTTADTPGLPARSAPRSCSVCGPADRMTGRPAPFAAAKPA